MKVSQDSPLVAEMTTWRRHFHAYPETAFEEVMTSDFVKARLEEFGLEVHQGLAVTGVVATLKNGDGPAIALRADMDALNMVEHSGVPHCSTHDGKMHGCGHDGHMAMLLGAAKYLSENRNFNGTIYFVFQPAEETKGGGRVMVQEGLFDKFPAEAVFGMHNWPEMPAGTMAMKPGPLMAAAGTMEIKIVGEGCHGAMPHLGRDPVVIASEVVMALQTIPARVVNPLDAAVVTVAQINAGHTWNVIPEDVTMRGTVRSFRTEVHETIVEKMERIVKGICEAHGASYSFNYMPGYPATLNDAEQTKVCARAAIQTVGEDNVDFDPVPSMGAEDFSYMLQAKPGCYVWLGTGGIPGGCLLHNPGFDFNDDVLHIGASYWVNLVEDILKA
ncbi:M20 aminoacylase family protein [Terasakiella sp. A23]|uniref:M20 aminoacylase family protein n=1 Tax=Terasakiella sp. FCG-A23 TaxID=3080561 RepID=UPI002954F2CB|nr:M20 aminoacylase family protein [Terasakiella sp. A23]MDV7340104.1 M20 aminoacylase family protein [Terasakiella sp. A23]